MVRLFNAVVHFFRVRTASFVPAGGWLIRVLKRLPATVAGFFLFVYVYGPAYQRYRGTFVAARAWYRTFGLRFRWRGGLSSGPVQRHRWSPRSFGRVVRLRPEWNFRPYRESFELFDTETYSLESAFPVVGHEPFQEYGHEHFDAQQDLDTAQDDEPHDDHDYLWGTQEPVFGLDEVVGYERDRFRQLERRKAFDREDYYLLDEQVDAFRTRPRRGTLARLVTPGDGPAEEDQDEPEYGTTEWTGMVDWYHYQSVPTRISDLPPLGGDFSYLFYEHKLSYRPDPTGRPLGWYRVGRGLVPWLYRTRRARWGRTRWRIQRYYRWAYRRERFGSWQTRRRRRHLRLPMYWLNVRWHRPGWIPGNFALDLFGGPPGRRGLVRRVSRFAQRVQRFGAGVIWRRRRRPPGRPGVHLSDRSVRDSRRGQLFRGGFARATGWYGRGRSRIAPWHAPRYVPAYDRVRTAREGLPGHPGGLPPTGAALVGALFVGYLALNVVVTAGVAYFCYILRLDEDPYHPIDVWGFLEDPAWRPDFFRRVFEGFPDALEVRRESIPRERVTTKAYALWTTPVGRDWRDNPGVDPGLLASRFADPMRVILGYESWWFTALNEQMMIFNKRIAVDRRGIFFWLFGWRQPSWVHMDDRIGDEWVHDPMFRLYHGELEPFTYRREMDHRYHRYAALGWKINEQFEENEIDDHVDELLNRLWHYYRGLGVHHFLALPEWIPRDASRRFHVDYAGYWALMMHTAAWPSASHLDFWSTVFYPGLSDTYDRIHRSAVMISDGHQLFDLVGRWDPYLNSELIRQWDRPVEFPFRELGWRPHRVVPWVDGQVRSLVWAVPVWAELARTWFYGATLVCWFFFRGVHLQTLGYPGDVGTCPVGRFARGGRPPRAISRGWRRSRGPRLGRDFSEWSRVAPSRLSWRWNKETHWATFRRGRTTEFFRPRFRSPLFGRSSFFTPTSFRGTVPTRPTGVAGLLYQSARVGVAAAPRRSATPPARPVGSFPGWLVRPVPFLPYHSEYRSDERPSLFRPGRPAQDRRIHPDGTHPERHRHRHLRGPARGVTRLDPPTLGTPVTWAYRGHSTARVVQHAWHVRRYRHTLGGVSPLTFPGGSGFIIRTARAALAGVDYPGRTAHLGEVTPDNGYDPSGVTDEENDDFVNAGNNHHEDVEEVDDFTDPDEEHEGLRYLSVTADPRVTISGWGDHHLRRRLNAYDRWGTLPGGSYEFAALADYFDDHTATQWSPAGADHPGWGWSLLGPYPVAAWGRRTARGVRPPGWSAPVCRRRRRRRRRARPGRTELLWPTGWDPLWDELIVGEWVVCEVGDSGDYYLDDLDVVEFGGIPREGYRPAAAAAFAAAAVRPTAVAALAGPEWAPAGGWNTWRYLAGEHLGVSSRDDPEGYLLERLTRTYLDQFDEFIFVADLELLIDRDFDDLHEGAPFEEDNQEVPRPRPRDYPGWLVAAAVAGVSAGDISEAGRAGRLADHDAFPEAQAVTHRPGRNELRRYYQKWRTATRRARREGVRMERFVGGELQLLADELGLADSTPALTDEVDALASASIEPLEGDDWTEESLRVWALTEVYWGDLPQGSANAH